jgi:hypothetical protein
VETTLTTYIQEVIGLNLGWDTDYLDWGFHGFPVPPG